MATLSGGRQHERRCCPNDLEGCGCLLPIFLTIGNYDHNNDVRRRISRRHRGRHIRGPYGT